MQLQIEISKFDSDVDLEDAFEQSLQQYVICPFADRLQGLLTDIFQELNLKEKLVKDLKEAKKIKKRFAQKTPVKKVQKLDQ